MADFLEERLHELIQYGSSYVDDYAVDVAETSGGQEYRSMIHPFPRRKFDISYLLETDASHQLLLAVYHRAHGRFAGFRARCFDEYSSNGRVGAPTAFDQPMAPVASGVYQLQKQYGTDKAAGATGYPVRTIFKPVTGTVKVAIGGTEIRALDWAVVTSTGRVTFAADQSGAIVSISQAAQAVLGITAHPFVVGQSLHVSGVAGMTDINGRRALIVAKTADSVTLDVDSSAFSPYTSGGTVHTRPQSGELVKAGFEFDFPVRFNSSLPIGQDYPGMRSVDGIELIELLNP